MRGDDNFGLPLHSLRSSSGSSVSSATLPYAFASVSRQGQGKFKCVGTYLLFDASKVATYREANVAQISETVKNRVIAVYA